MMTVMSDNKTKNIKGTETPRQNNYYICERCGYISILRDSICPICIKENIHINLIKVFDYEN